MELNIICTSRPEAREYLKIIYQDEEMYIDEFVKLIGGEIFDPDIRVRDCDIKYRGKILSYDDLCDKHKTFCESLKQVKLSYTSTIDKQDLFLIDEDCFAAYRMLESAETQLDLARFYLARASNVFDLNYNVTWSAGYDFLYMYRGFDASTAIMWYNNTLDTVFQMPFLAFGIYKHHLDYKDGMDFQQKINLCKYESFSSIYSKNKQIKNFPELWKILMKAYTSNKDINEWANTIKHKGGVNYIGVNAEPPYKISVKPDTGKGRSTDDTRPLFLDLDDVTRSLADQHSVLCKVISELVQFINFEQIKCTRNGDKKVFPEPSEYKKIIM